MLHEFDELNYSDTTGLGLTFWDPAAPESRSRNKSFIYDIALAFSLIPPYGFHYALA